MQQLLSIDVEDWFQVENLKDAIDHSSWGERLSRVERNISLILELLNERNCKATFFILGWIAERYPELIKKIYNEGHEIACHGYNHELVYKLDKEQFKNDVRRAQGILQDITGNRIIGYRAPSFSITDWAIDILIDMGFKYDSSLFQTIARGRYGKLDKYKIPSAPIFKVRNDFYQVMLSSLDVYGLKIPWAGGFYFRVTPYQIFKSGIKKILKNKGAYLFYIHPWEFDPEQPRIKNIKLNYQFRHYTNLNKTEVKFKKLLSDFNFAPIKNAIPK
jgi:polysaccharide deacetylase family protein (PEP-CTERM system associated)